MVGFVWDFNGQLLQGPMVAGAVGATVQGRCDEYRLHEGFIFEIAKGALNLRA